MIKITIEDETELVGVKDKHSWTLVIRPTPIAGFFPDFAYAIA